MTRTDCLSAAAKLITEDRAASYGDNRDTHHRVSVMWTALTGHPISPEQVCVMMAALKLCRLAHDSQSVDSWVDACGYIALGAELAGGE
jgi:hypothetical protein